VSAILLRKPRPVADAAPYTVSSPADEDEWQDVVGSALSALPTQTPAWLRCVCAVDGYEDASRLYRTADGRRLVLPLVRRRVLHRQQHLPVSGVAVPAAGSAAGAFAVQAALPYGWGPGGLLGDRDRVRPSDIRMVVEDLARQPALSTWLRPDPAMATIWATGIPPGVRREAGMAQTVFLDGGFGRVWRARFRSDTRNRVRRAERAGVVVECDDTGRLVPVFQQLYASSVPRWARRDGRPLAVARWQASRHEPDWKLPTVATMMGGACRIYAAFWQGEPVAAIVVLLSRRAAAYWRGAMHEELAGRTYANYLLHRTAIEDAARAGCTRYQMGESAPGSSLALFKSRFGAVEQHYASYRIERLPLSPLLERARGGIHRLLRLWTGRG
jgi:hypothetical protein